MYRLTAGFTQITQYITGEHDPIMSMVKSFLTASLIFPPERFDNFSRNYYYLQMYVPFVISILLFVRFVFSILLFVQYCYFWFRLVSERTRGSCFISLHFSFFVFSSHFILDVKFVGCTRRSPTGGRLHRISHPPSFCGACLYFSCEKDSAVPSLRRQ